MPVTEPNGLVKHLLELQAQVESQNRSFQKALLAIGEGRDLEAVNELGEIVTRAQRIANAASEVRAEIDSVGVE